MLKQTLPAWFPIRDEDMLLNFAMLSDTGRVRRRNEDACAADAEHGIFVVCDGVGGAAGGEIASRLAAETFVAHLVEMQQASVAPEVGIHNGIEHANRTVHRNSQQLPSLRGMATTMVALSFDFADGREDAGIVWLANVGDSRCYRLRNGQLEQLTLDHSVVEEQVRAGEMTREQAANSPIRNVITRAIGSDTSVAADVRSLAVEQDDLFLLSTDGLTRELADDQIAAVLGSIVMPSATDSDEPPSNSALAAACRELVRAANYSGGADNITCLLVHVV